MALVIGGVTVTGTQTLDASKLTGTASAINGSNLTNLPAPSTANVGTATAGFSRGDVGSYASHYFRDGVTGGNTFNPGANISYYSHSSTTPSGTWRLMGSAGTGDQATCLRTA
jgi:hypothetical protein|tara:strand:- start:695 stop:1033 length:339 start_codon:yes stop_codon:yes gene_type:complete